MNINYIDYISAALKRSIAIDNLSSIGNFSFIELQLPIYAPRRETKI